MPAQLVLKTRPGANYADGDIISAYSRRRIRHVNAQLICSARDAKGKKPAGRLRDGTLLETYLAATQTYKWERIGRDRVRRTNLRTLSEVEYGSTPVEDPDDPGHMIHCNVEEWVARRLAGGKYPLFGSPGAERFYLGAGKCVCDHAALDTIWAAIETQTPEREADHTSMPFTAAQLRSELVVTTDDFDDQTAFDLTTPVRDRDGIVAKRGQKVDWRAKLTVNEADVLDRDTIVDIRSTEYARATIVEAKP